MRDNETGKDVGARPRVKVTKKGLILRSGAIWIRPMKKRRETARRWAEKRTREELIEAVAILFQKRAEDRLELQTRYMESVLAPDRQAKKRAKDNAAKKIEKNPEAAAIARAKASARTLFLERRAGKHPKLATVDQFAMEACRRWKALTSIGSIRQWATEWEAIEAARPKVKALWVGILRGTHKMGIVTKEDGVVVPLPDGLAAVAVHEGIATHAVAMELAKEFNAEHKTKKLTC